MSAKTQNKDSAVARLENGRGQARGQEPDRVWITRGAEGTRAGESSVRACGARSNSERLRREGTARSGLAQHGGGGWSEPSVPLAPALKITEKAPDKASRASTFLGSKNHPARWVRF